MLRMSEIKARMRRFGESCDWRCTYAELALAAGVNRRTARTICRAMGWIVTYGALPPHEPMAVDVFMSTMAPATNNHY